MSDELFSTPLLGSLDLQVGSVGQGFDIYGRMDTSSFIQQLFDFSKAEKKTIQFLGHEYEIPVCVDFIENISTDIDKGAYDTRDEVQTKIAASAKVEGSAGAFSGEMDAAYSSSYMSSSEYSYSFIDTNIQLGFMQLVDAGRFITDGFRQAIDGLPRNFKAGSLDKFREFFELYGPYYTTNVILGGRFAFYTATSKDSSVKTNDMLATLQTQYSGLFVKGSFHADFSCSSDWKSYSENSSFSLRAFGGDPALAAKLIGTTPTDPSADSVAAYDEWVASVQGDPAIVDFSLRGIWELCGERAQVVEEAWTSFRDIMHPRLTIATQSSLIAEPLSKPISMPTVTLSPLDKPITPTNEPTSGSGWLVILIDCKKDLSKESCVRKAEYYCLPSHGSWMPYYLDLSDRISVLLQNRSKQELLVMVSFGLDANMVPSNAMQSVMRSFGARRQLEQWISTVSSPGSEGGSYVQNPFAYCLIGLAQSGPGRGIEGKIEYNEGFLTMNAYLFRTGFNAEYTVDA